MAVQRVAPRTGVATVRFTEPIVLTEQLSKSGGSLVVTIPKHIVSLLQLDNTSALELSVRKVVAIPIQPSEFEAA